VYDLRGNTWRVLDVDAHPPADKSSPVLVADTRNGIVLCSVRGADGQETWALDVGKPRWTRLNLAPEPDPSGNRNRVLLYLEDENLFVLENRTKDEQQIWTFRYAEAPPPPARLENLQVVTEADAATLTWRPSSAERPFGVNVYRGQGERPWEVELKLIAKAATANASFTDRNLLQNTIYHYRVREVAADGRERASSRIARTQPPVPLDLAVSVLGPQRVELQWAKVPAADVVGYHVERADVSVYSTDQLTRIKRRRQASPAPAVGYVRRIGAFQRLTRTPLEKIGFGDEAVDLAAGQKTPPEPWSVDRVLHAEHLDLTGKAYPLAVYAYRVIAVNRLGVESGPSPLAFTYPAAVQHVFAKEEGTDATRLRWQPNPEKAIAGYHVYRHNGRWNTDPIVRLTAKPVAACEFLDATAGTSTRRYEVVAVDALGQEGEPSQPVWSRREWRRFYVPYVDDWHQ
jgi:hypothetical protein